MKPIQLFCFPYAGSSAVIYGGWKHHLAPALSLRMVELPGRGKRYREPLIDAVPELVEDLYLQIQNELTESPYAFFGHSLGAILVFELAHKIAKQDKPLPEHIFFSGQNAPHQRDNYKIDHELEDSKFIGEIVKLGGTSKEVFQNAELSRLFLPVIRNDIKAANRYRYLEKAKLDVNATVLYGEDDPLGTMYQEWSNHIGKKCALRSFEGGHFFIQENKERIIEYINETLLTDREEE